MKTKPWENGSLRVAGDGPYFVNGEEPFFWLGDTAWLLVHSLTREEIAEYLENRAGKGFTLIQVVAVHRMPARNAYGREAFLDGDMSLPVTEGEDSYWSTLDYVMEKAEELGLYIGLLPHWGGIVKGGHIGPEQMPAYLDFLAKRYGDRPNMLWILGGDIRGNRHYDYWRAMGERLRRATPDKLITFHPFGRTTSIDYFEKEEWMDFHMYQSGHRRYDQETLNQWDDTSKDSYYYGEDSFRYVQRVHVRQPDMPVVDGEPSYEHIPQGLHDTTQPFWQACDVRRYAYWAVLEGAAGFTYGHSSIMQFFTGEGKGAYGASIPWKDAVHSPGSDSMSHLASLMGQVPFYKGRPGERYLACPQGEKYERIAVMAGEEFALFYTYTGRTIAVKEEIFGGKAAKAWWFSPNTGVMSYIGCRAASLLTFTPPVGEYPDKDWVLVLRPAGESV